MRATTRQSAERMMRSIVLAGCVGGSLLFCTVVADEFDPDTPITAVHIQDMTDDEVWLVDSLNTLTCSTSTDTDRYREDADHPWTDVDDSISYIWSGSGTFVNNDYIGSSVDYITPYVDSYDVISVAANDDCAADNNVAVVDENPAVDARTVRTVAMEVYQVGFTGGVALMRTPTAPASQWDDGTVAIANPIYDADDNATEMAAKNHVCHVRGSTGINAQARCRTTDAVTKDQSFKIRSTGNTDWNWGTGSIAKGSKISSQITCSLNGALYSKCGFFNRTCNWKFIHPTGANVERDLNSTTHSVYLTYDTPAGSVVTVKRIRFVCSAAQDLPTANGGAGLTECADAVFGGLNATFDLNAAVNGPSPIWLVHDGEPSQCPGLALYVSKHFALLGLGAGEIRYCCAKADGTYDAPTTAPGTVWRDIIPGTGHPNPTTHDDSWTQERLAMVDGNGNGNNYEAACFLNGWYYALVGAGVKKASTIKSVMQVFTSIEWQYRTGTSPNFVWRKCTEDPWVEAP